MECGKHISYTFDTADSTLFDFAKNAKLHISHLQNHTCDLKQGEVAHVKVEKRLMCADRHTHVAHFTFPKSSLCDLKQGRLRMSK